MTKQLHEKKISELYDDVMATKDSPKIGFSGDFYKLLKQWAIAIVKDCYEKHDAKNRGHYCQVCEFLIDRFELTEEHISPT